MLELYVVLHSIAYSILQIPQEKNCRTVFFFFFSMALQRQLHVEPSIASLSMASEGTRTGCSRSPFFFAGLPGLKHPVFATKENGKPWFFGQDSDL